MASLRIEGLCKEFPSAAEQLQVLQDVNLELQSGENVSLVGPSGCGKSTLLYIIGTLDQPTQGTVELDGVFPFEMKPKDLARYRNENIGFVFQDHHLLPQLTVTENVLLSALASGAPSESKLERASQLIEAVGLSERAGHLPSQLSGGERQRVAVARALLQKPKLILADEPTGNLDQANTERIAELLFELPQQEGAMLFVVTHSQWLAEQAGTRMKFEDKKIVSA